MKYAVFISTRYGSIAQYAQWISEATDVPAFDVNRDNADPSRYDFLILGGPIIYHKLAMHKWMKRNSAFIEKRPAILFSVSGAGAGPKLDGWIAGSLPEELISHVTHIALRGRQNPRDLNWYDRFMLIIGGLKNLDPVAAKEEMQGFDFMDKTSIEPIVEMARRLQGNQAGNS